jgi:hypothetical protein
MLQAIALALTCPSWFAFDNLIERFIGLILEEFALVGNPAEQAIGELAVLSQPPNVHGYPEPRAGPQGLAGAFEECLAILRAGVDSVRSLPLQQQFFQVPIFPFHPAAQVAELIWTGVKSSPLMMRFSRG